MPAILITGANFEEALHADRPALADFRVPSGAAPAE